MSAGQSERQTLAAFINNRHAAGRTVTVLVDGDFNTDPPLGRGAAVHVAHLLVGDGGTVIRRAEGYDGDALADGDVAIFTLPPDDDQWAHKIAEATNFGRVQDANLVVHTADPKPRFRRVADARVAVDGIDDPLRAFLLRTNPYEGETYEVKLDGIGASEGGDSA